MPLFSGSKKQLQADAQRYTKRAKQEAAEAQNLKTKAANLRKADRNSRYPDPAATKAITRDLDMDRRTREQNAKNYRGAAAAATRASKRWF